MTGFNSKRRAALEKLKKSEDLLEESVKALKAALEQPEPLYTTPPAAQPPAEWELIKNILAEYGLDAIAFVAQWKAAQRTWVGLTEEDWDKVGDMPDTFDQGVAWAAARLKERNT